MLAVIRIRSIAAVLTAIAMTCGLSVGMAEEIAEPKSEKDADYYQLMKTFVDTFEQIDRNYVTDVDRRKLMEAAIQGMLKDLDPYSTFIPPEELARFNQSVDQEFGGIGIQVQIDPESNRLTVITPLPGTPAYKAGVRAGDVIVEIEGKPTDGYSIDDAVKALKGKPGEEVSIGVLHLGETKPETLTMERDIIKMDTILGFNRVEGKDTWNFMLDDERKIGYVRMSHFSRRTADELLKAMEDLQEKGMKALGLDLQFNPGGWLSQAPQIADFFLEDGRIVSTKGRNTPERVWDAHKPGTFKDFPMVVLINRFSASASEILSAALQDHKRALVVGERSWGKGSVQNVIELDNGASALKLTTATYHRPSGKNIHRNAESEKTGEWGVMPDVVVKFSNEEIKKYLDDRRDRDIIREEGTSESEFKDRQLSRALKYLENKLEGKPDEEPAPSTAEKKAA